MTPLDGGVFLERMSWWESGGYFLIFLVAVFAARRGVARGAGFLAGALAGKVLLQAAIIGLIASPSWATRLLAPNPNILPGMVAVAVFCRLALTRNVAVSALALAALVRVLPNAAMLVLLLALYPLFLLLEDVEREELLPELA